MSLEKQTDRYIAPEDHTAGSNTPGLSNRLDIPQIEGWHDAVDRQLQKATDEVEIDTLSKSKEELAALRAVGIARAEGIHAGIAGIPLAALRGQTQPGDHNHVPSISLTKKP